MIHHAKHYATGEPLAVTIEGGRISAISESDQKPTQWIAPAFCDPQINGCLGISFNSPSLTADEIRKVVDVCRKHGIGTFLPTLITTSDESFRHGFATLAKTIDSDAELAQRIPGFHLEGPYLSGEDGARGAHPREHARDPNWDEFQRWQDAAGGRIRMVTLAPERTGATTSTHLGNGSHAMLPRHDNYIWEQLANDGLWASIITDGHHLPPALVKCIVRVKGVGRTLLTCDAGTLAGMPPGKYTSWGTEMEVLPSGKIVVAGTPFLAGSGHFTDACIGNVIRYGGVTLAEAIDMATARPRQLLRFPVHTIAVGQPADVMLFDWEPGGDLRIVAMM